MRLHSQAAISAGGSRRRRSSFPMVLLVCSTKRVLIRAGAVWSKESGSSARSKNSIRLFFFSYSGRRGADDISEQSGFEAVTALARLCVQTEHSKREGQVRRWPWSPEVASGRRRRGRRRGSTTTSSRCRGACCARCAPGTAQPAAPNPHPPTPTTLPMVYFHFHKTQQASFRGLFHPLFSPLFVCLAAVLS